MSEPELPNCVICHQHYAKEGGYIRLSAIHQAAMEKRHLKRPPSETQCIERYMRNYHSAHGLALVEPARDSAPTTEGDET